MTANVKLNIRKYRKLVSKALPVIIESDEEYERLRDEVWELISKGEKNLTVEEDMLLGLLSKLVDDYENRTMPVPDVPPNRILKHLMEVRELKQSALVPIFGTSGRVSEILSGKREISKIQAKALAKQFNVSAELFI